MGCAYPALTNVKHSTLRLAGRSASGGDGATRATDRSPEHRYAKVGREGRHRRWRRRPRRGNIRGGCVFCSSALAIDLISAATSSCSSGSAPSMSVNPTALPQPRSRISRVRRDPVRVPRGRVGCNLQKDLGKEGGRAPQCIAEHAGHTLRSARRVAALPRHEAPPGDTAELRCFAVVTNGLPCGRSIAAGAVVGGRSPSGWQIYERAE